jgi:hypothetical protein
MDRSDREGINLFLGLQKQSDHHREVGTSTAFKGRALLSLICRYVDPVNASGPDRLSGWGLRPPG